MPQESAPLLSPADLPGNMRPAAIAKTLEIFNDVWSFSVLQELFFGVKRFDDIQKNLNISRSVLTRRLRHLEAESIISRHQYSSRPARYEYRLTERGIDMYPIFVLLKSWGEKWLDNAKDSELTLIHSPCHKPLKVSLNCTHCNEPVNARNVTAKEKPRK